MQLHSTSGQWRLGLALSMVTVFLWGILPLFLRLMLQPLDAYTLTWFRFLVAFGFLAIYLVKRQQLPAFKDLRKIPLALILVAVIGLGGNYLLFLMGLAQTSPANAQVLGQVAPVLMGLGGLAIFKERYTRQQWLGLGILTLGLALFFHEKLTTLITAQTQYLIGSGLILVSAAVWAMYALAQKQLLQQLPSSNIMLMVYGGCALFIGPATTPQSLLTLSPLQWVFLMFCALNTLVAYGAFAEALEHWEASRVSAVLALTPIVTMISVWVASSIFPTVITPEPLTILAVFGACLVVGGSMTIALGKR